MAVPAAVVVCTGLAMMPGRDPGISLSASTRLPTTLSAPVKLPESTTRNLFTGSIHSVVEDRLVNARGSRDWMASSLNSFLILALTRSRPVSCLYFSTRSSTSALTAEAGTGRRSMHSRRMICGPTVSSSTVLLLPRGGTQPTDSGWVAPQGMNWADCSASSSASRGGMTKSAEIRKKEADLNMDFRGVGMQDERAAPLQMLEILRR